MLNTKQLLAMSSITLAMSVVSAIADDHSETECKTVSTDMISLYYMTAINHDGEIGNFYESKVSLINSLAKKYEWMNYKMTSQDVSVNNSSYGTDVFEVSVSMSFQFDADYKAITQVAKEAGAYSVSASRYDEQVCPDGYSY